MMIRCSFLVSIFGGKTKSRFGPKFDGWIGSGVRVSVSFQIVSKGVVISGNITRGLCHGLVGRFPHWFKGMKWTGLLNGIAVCQRSYFFIPRTAAFIHLSTLPSSRFTVRA